MLANEAYTGTLVWGANAKDGTPPIRIENAFPAIVSQQEFRKVRRLLKSRAPSKVNPRRGLQRLPAQRAAQVRDLRQGHDRRRRQERPVHLLRLPLSAEEGQGHLPKRPGSTLSPSRKLIIDQIRENVLTESNIRDLVKLLDEEMDGAAREQRSGWRLSSRSWRT